MAAETPSPRPARPPPLVILLWALVTAVCLLGLATMLIVPAQSKTVGLVYGGF